MPLVNLEGYGVALGINSERILAVKSVKDEPTKRLLKEMREDGTLIDATNGHKTQSAMFLSGSADAISPVVIALNLAPIEVIEQVNLQEAAWRGSIAGCGGCSTGRDE